MDNKVCLDIKNVNKRFGNKTIINNFSLEAKSGEILGLLGPNGAGKTTLIRLIVNLIKANSGEILINGKNIEKDFEEAIKNVGAIVENPEFYKSLSGYKNLLHYARMYPNVSSQRINEVASIVGLSEKIKDPVKTYSLGMRQRLGIAVALLNKPTLLILDEPTNGLDPEGILELRNYLKNLAHKENTAILVSSHILSEMELMCDKFAIINNGQLVDVKNLKEPSSDDDIEVFWETDLMDSTKNLILSLGLKCSFKENGFTLVTKREDIPGINKKLVSMGIDFYSILKQKKSLEETFMELTGGEHK